MWCGSPHTQSSSAVCLVTPRMSVVLRSIMNLVRFRVITRFYGRSNFCMMNQLCVRVNWHVHTLLFSPCGVCVLCLSPDYIGEKRREHMNSEHNTHFLSRHCLVRLDALLQAFPILETGRAGIGASSPEIVHRKRADKGFGERRRGCSL